MALAYCSTSVEGDVGYSREAARGTHGHRCIAFDNRIKSMARVAKSAQGLLSRELNEGEIDAERLPRS